jgi:GNAT superfamily N-acetyltransferase
MAAVRIDEAGTAEDLAEAGRLMRDYLSGLPFVVDFQDVDAELADLGRVYAPPRGAVLLARPAGDPGPAAVGVVGITDFGDDRVELKRMYVAPEARGSGAGRALAERAIARARELGYRQMLLDTVASLTAAIALYESLGFVAIDAYRFNPRPDARYFALDL